MRKNIGKRLKLFRETAKITQAELGEKLGIMFQHVSKYERGETVPTWENLIKLHELYQVNINWLLTGKGSMFTSALNYNQETGTAKTIVKDSTVDPQLEEIMEELNYDHELKEIIYEYIKNYRNIRFTTARLHEKIDRMKKNL